MELQSSSQLLFHYSIQQLNYSCLFLHQMQFMYFYHLLIDICLNFRMNFGKGLQWPQEKITNIVPGARFFVKLDLIAN